MNSTSNQLSSFQYTILPGKNCPPDQSELYDACYDFWFQFWSYVYKQNGTTAVPNADDFFRQDYIPIIHKDTEIVALHLYSLFELNTRAIYNHSYLHHNFTQEYHGLLKQKQIQSVMTMESLSVNPKYRKTQVGTSLAQSMGVLGQKLFLADTVCDAIICPARIDLKVTQIAQDIGFQILVPNLELYNTPVDLIACRREEVKPSSDFSVRRLTDELWGKRNIVRRQSLKKTQAA